MMGWKAVTDLVLQMGRLRPWGRALGQGPAASEGESWDSNPGLLPSSLIATSEGVSLGPSRGVAT